MKKRLLRFIKYLWVRYIPGTSQLTVMEAQRITKYFVENFNEHQQCILLDEIKQNLIMHRENQIIESELLIESELKRKQQLKTNLLTLTT